MNEQHRFSPEILKACDIRGIVGTDLTEADALHTGMAFATILSRRGIGSCAVGRDGRLSSESLAGRLLEGLAQGGIHAADLGLVPTPAVYHGVLKKGFPAGVMVTASHNPPEYNGFKFVVGREPFHGEDIAELARISREGDYIRGNGSVRPLDIRRDYTDYLAGTLDPGYSGKLKIVWDPGNGAAGAVLPALLEKIPGDHRIICGEVDGTFPNHHPDPSLEANVRLLQETVRREQADLGIAFDGDGDRLGVVDGEGVLLYGDQLLTLYARDLLARRPGERVMSEVKASRFFYDDVAARGGIPLMWKVGHTNQKEKMYREKILLAGETSGHIFFADNGGFDDALFSAVRLLNILGSGGPSLTELRKEFPVYWDSGEIRIPLDSEGRARVIREIADGLRAEGRQFVDLDGIRADRADGFWMIRGSNTQPHMTIRCEAASRRGLEDCLSDLGRLLGRAGIPLPAAGGKG